SFSVAPHYCLSSIREPLPVISQHQSRPQAHHSRRATHAHADALAHAHAHAHTHTHTHTHTLACFSFSLLLMPPPPSLSLSHTLSQLTRASWSESVYISV